MKTPQLILLTALVALNVGADSNAPLETHGPKPAVQPSPHLTQKLVPAPRLVDVKNNAIPPRVSAVVKPVANSIGGPSRNRAGAIVPNVKPAGSINGTGLKPKP